MKKDLTIIIDKPVKKEEDLFSEIFDKYYVRLCYYSHTFIDDFEACKDIVQDIFIKLWEGKINNLSPVELDRILYRSVKNGCLDYIRKQKVRQNSRSFILQRLLEEEEIFIPELELKELSKKIEQALNDLPERTYTIFKMSRHDEKSYAEIAQELNISVKGVEFHISKALNILRTQLKEYLPVFICLSILLDKS